MNGGNTDETHTRPNRHGGREVQLELDSGLDLHHPRRVLEGPYRDLAGVSQGKTAGGGVRGVQREGLPPPVLALPSGANGGSVIDAEIVSK